MFRIRQTLKNANFTMAKGRDLMRFIEAFIADIWDGYKVVVIPQPGFSSFFNKFIKTLATYMVALLMYKMIQLMPKVPFFPKKPSSPP